MKSIKIRAEINGKEQEFTLAFTNMTVRRLSRNGFKLENIVEAPLDGIPTLFAGAFLAFHPGTDRDEINKIWEDMPDKENLIKTLMAMYQEPINALLNEPKEKNATWEVVE